MSVYWSFKGAALALFILVERRLVCHFGEAANFLGVVLLPEATPEKETEATT